MPEDPSLHVAEVRAGDERLGKLVIMPLCFASDQLGESGDPRLVVVARVPDSPTEPPGRSTRAISTSATGWSNQWKAWATTTASADLPGSGIRSADPLSASTPGNVRSKLGEHLVQGLDGDHLVTERGQHPRQLARPGAEIDHPQRRIAGEPPRRLRRIARARALVDLGDRTERARPNRRVVAQTRPRSERIASTYVRVSAYRPCSRTAFAPW